MEQSQDGRRHNGRHKTTSQEKREIFERYMAGESGAEIAPDYGLKDPKSVLNIVRRLGGETRKRQGGRKPLPVEMLKPSCQGDGYLTVLLRPNDPFASMATAAGRVLEHRLVMARSLGRPLTSKETVHHINGDRADNRLENLQLRKGKHGTGEAYRCKDCGSYNVEAVPLEESDG